MGRDGRGLVAVGVLVAVTIYAVSVSIRAVLTPRSQAPALHAFEIAFTIVAVVAFLWYLRRFAGHEHAGVFLPFAAIGTVVFGVVFASIGAAIIVGQRELGIVMVDQLTVVIGLGLGGSLFGLLHGHLYGRSVQHQRDLERRARQLRTQQVQLEEFTSMVAHDLRNPLSVADGHATLAANERAGPHIEAVQHALARMDDLIEDLLAFARSGTLPEDCVPVDLSTVARDCWENVDTRNASLVVDDDVTVPADPNHLKRALENLFVNAVEHGGDDVTVTVGRQADGFYVEDDGAGIDPEDRDDVMQRGYSSSPDGTGLGLAIVEQVAGVHGWSVHLANSAGDGTRFEFSGVDVPSA